MKVAVLLFPGTNNEKDIVDLMTRHYQLSCDLVWHKDSEYSFSDVDLVVIPGGFSYGDYLRCGAMASVSPVMPSVIEYINKGGFVLGICNGFQILCEVGVLPGALTFNESEKFICQDVFLKSITPSSFMSFQKNILKLPIAHGEGRYIVDDPESLFKKSQVALTYINQAGRDENINGSVRSIAGVYNEQKNVLGMMPHPERATDLRSGDGHLIWNSLMEAC